MAKKGARRGQARPAARQSQARKAAAESVKSSGAAATSGDGSSKSSAHLGLVNLGNTCFLNSIVQCLNVSAPFSDELIGISKEGLGGIGTSLCGVFKGLRGQETSSSAKSKGGGAVSPKPLLTCLVSRFPWYRGGEQQDAHEFLRMLLGTLSDETTMSERKAAKSDKENSARQPGMPTGHCEQTVWDNFRGHLGAAVLCWNCKRVSISLDPFLDLSLTIPSHIQPAGVLGMSPAAMRPQTSRSADASGANADDAGDAGAGEDADADADGADAEDSEDQDGHTLSKRELKKRRRKTKQRAEAAATSSSTCDADPNAISRSAPGANGSMAAEESAKECVEALMSATLERVLAIETARTYVQRLTQASTVPDSDSRSIGSTTIGAACEAVQGGSADIAGSATDRPIDAISSAQAEDAEDKDNLDTGASASGAVADAVAQSSTPGEGGGSSDAAAKAATSGEASADTGTFEVQLSRDSKGTDTRWGFQWNVERLAEGLLVVQGVAEDSMVDRWNLKRRSMGDEERIIRPGDWLVAVNGCKKREKMQKALKEDNAVTLEFSHSGKEASAEGAGTSSAGASAGSGRAAARQKKQKAAAESAIDEQESAAKRAEDEARRAQAREARRLAFCEDATRCHQSLPEAVQRAFEVEKLEAKSQFELADCLRTSLSMVEALEEDFAPTFRCAECSQDNSRSYASRRVWLWPPLPRLLTVQLKRFRRRGAAARFEKSSDCVNMPAQLDLSDFILKEAEYNSLSPHLGADSVREPPPTLDATACQYELYGVCVHQGSSMQNGHYVAYVNAGPSLEKEEWYGASDSHVWKCTRAEVLKVQAYVAFYRKEGVLKASEASERPQDEEEDDGDAEAEDDAASSDKGN